MDKEQSIKIVVPSELLIPPAIAQTDGEAGAPDRYCKVLLSSIMSSNQIIILIEIEHLVHCFVIVSWT